MQDISAVIDATNGVNASEFKQVCGEEENFIESAGITLNQSDTTQIGKAAAVYAGSADAYNDISVSANLISLSPIGNKKYPPAYSYGLRVRFRPAFSNTITQPNIKLPGMANVPLGTRTVTTPTLPTVAVGFLNTSKWYTAVYTTNGLIDYFRLENIIESYDLPLNVIEEGNIDSLAVTNNKLGVGAVSTSKIQDGVVTNVKLASDIQLDKISGGTLGISSGGVTLVMTASGISYSGTDRQSRLKDTGVTFITTSPGITVYMWRTKFDIDSGDLSYSSGDKLLTWSPTSNFELLGVPVGSRIQNVFLETQSSGYATVYPLQCDFADLSTDNWWITNGYGFGGSPVTGTAARIWVDFDPVT